MDAMTLPFDNEECNDPTTVRAIVEVGRGERPGPFSGPHAGAYGVVLWGRGMAGVRMWGAGYASSDDMLRAAGILRIIETYRHTGARIIIHSCGLSDQLKHVDRSNGFKADRKTRFRGFEVFKPLQNARKAGAWTLQVYRKGGEPRGVKWADNIAEHGLIIAKKHEGIFEHFVADHPDYAILATDLDPDPHGVVAKLAASA